MKMDKTKAIISTLAVALVITTSLAILNVTRINNDKKKGAIADMPEQPLTQTLTKESEKTSCEITTKENAEETNETTEPTINKIILNGNFTKAVQGTLPPAIENTKIPQNQIIKDNSGNTINFTEVSIKENEFITVRFKHERENTVNIFMVNGYDMTYTDDKGNTMGKPDGYGTKYKCIELTGAMLAYDPDITSITVSYTFPDGTNASAVLNLK